MMKTMLKKLTALILAVALCASFAVMPSMAAEVTTEETASAVVTIGNATITEAGKYVDVPVSVSFKDRATKVDAFGFAFDFETDDLCVHAPANAFDSSVTLTNTLCAAVTASAEEQTVTYATADESRMLYQDAIDYYGTNVMFYLRVEAKEGFANGTYTLDADLIDGLGANFSYNKQPVDVVIKPGTITLNAPSELEYPLNMLDIDIPTDAVYDGTAHSVTVTPKAGSGLTVYAVYYQKEGTNITTAAPYNAGEYTISADVYDGTTVYSKLEVGTMTVEKATLPDIVAVSGLKYSSVYQVLFKIPDGFDSTYYAAGSTVPYINGASLNSFTAQNPDTGVVKSAFNVRNQTGIWVVSYKVNSKYAENYQLVDGDANRIVYGFVRADGKATGAPGRSYLVSKPVDPQESFVYDGKSHSPNPPVKNSFTYMTYSKFTAQKDVGEYTYRYTLAANYEWADATSDWEALAPHIITWKITPAAPTINVDTSFVVTPGDSFTLGGTATGLSNLNHNLTAGLTYSVPEGSPLVVDETTGVVTVPETTAVGAYTVYVTYVPTTAAPYKNYAETTVPVTVVVNNVRVSLPSVSKTYNGNPIEVTDLFDGPASVTEDGQPLEGTVTYVFGGQTYSSWEALSAATVTDAGDYTLAVTYVSSDLSVTVTKNFVSTVERLQVEIPTPVTGLVYDGNEQSGFDEAALNNPYYTHSGTAATDSGTYYASFTLKDTANTCWSDGTVAVKQIAWTIVTVAGVSIPEMPEHNYVYDGVTTYTCPLVPGEDALYTMTGTTTGKTPGPYSVTLTPKANYAWADLQPGDPGYKEEYAEYYGTSKSIKLTWNIQRADPVVNYTEIDVVLDGPTVSLKDALTGLPGLGHDLSAVVQKQSDYPAWAANGSVRYLTYTNPYDTSVIKVSASSGNITATQEGMYLITVSYDNHNWNPNGYGYATYYNSKSVTVIVHVKPKDEVNIDFAATTPSATYTGEAFTLGDFFTVPATVTGMDDAVVTYTFNGTVYTWEELLEQTVTDIGDYTVTARYEDDTHIGETVATFKVTGIPIPEDMMPQWDPDNLTFVYDGTRKEPIIVPAGSEAYYGINVSYGRTSAVDAGVYTVKFYLKDGNTCWPDGTRLPLEITWTIQRAPLAVKPVDQDIKMPYTGQQQHTPYQNGQYYTVMGNIAAVNADSYVSKATPDANYAWEDGTTDPVNLNWTITKINPVVHVNMSGAFGEFFTTPGNSIPISEIMSGLAGDDLTPFITVSVVGVSDAVYYDEGNHVLVVPAGADIGARNMFRVSYTAPILDDVGGDVTLYGRMNSYQNYELYVYINVVEAGVAEITFAANPNAITYTGSPISLGQFFHNPATADALGTITYNFGGETGLTWEQLLTKTVTEVGTYEVTVNLVGYAHTGTKTVTFQVTKANQAPITISGNAGMKVGEQQVLTVSGGTTGGAITWAIKSGSEFASISAGGALSAHKAGTVVVTATMAGNDTYEDVTAEFTVVISRNQVATPEALIKTDLVYNAEEQTALAVADNAPYTVTGHKQTDAGTYELTVSLTDTDSFEWTDGTTEPKTFSWSIAKAELSVSGLTWNYTAPFTYADGVTHTVVLNTLAGVSDKIDVEYVNNSAVNAGTYTASAVVTLKESFSKNYVAVDVDQVPTCTWTIDPQTIQMPEQLEWNYTEPFTFTGNPYTVEVTNLPAHTVVTYSTGVRGGRTMEESANSAIHAGTYNTTAFVQAENSNYKLEGTQVGNLQWVINPAEIPVPVFTDKVFNGETQHAFEVPADAVYSVEGNDGIDAGKYTVTLTLPSKDYKWVHPTYTIQRLDYSADWYITKAKIDVSDYEWNYTDAFTFDGETKTVELKSYSDMLIATYTGNTGAAVGDYTASVSFQIKDEYTGNYEIEGSVEALSWSIVADKVTVPTVSNTELVYNGEEQTVFTAPNGALYTVSGNTGVNAGTYTMTFTLVDPDNYTWSDGTVEPKTKEWKILPQKVYVTNVELLEDTFTYEAGVEYTVALKELPDHVEFELTGDVAKTNAGNYTAIATLTVENGNYELVGNSVWNLSWTINKAKIDVSGYEWNYTDAFTYEAGVEHTVALKNVDSKLVATYTDNAKTNAGTYTAKVTFAVAAEYAANYEVDGSVENLSWTINKAKINVSGYEWNYTGAFTYTGETKTVELKNVDSKLVATYTDNAKTNTGTYTAKVTFAVADEYAANYEVEGSVEALSWTINKAKINVSGYEWNYTSAFTYTSETKTVELKNVDSKLVAAYTDNAKTDAGTYTAKVTFAVADEYAANYEVEGSVENLSWTINKAKISVAGYQWSYQNPFMYNGTVRNVWLKNVSDKLDVTYTDNAKTNVGTYTAKADFAVKAEYAANYEVVDEVADLVWSIEKNNVDVSDIVINKEYKYTLDGVVELTFELPADAGEISFGTVVEDDEHGIISAIAVENGKVILTLTGNAEAGDKATYTIPVEMGNYADINVIVNVTLLAREVPVTSTENIEITYGEDIPAITGESSVPGTWELIVDSLPEKLNVGTYDIQVRFVPTDIDNYAEVIHTVKLTVVPAEIAVSGVEWDYENPFTFNGGDYQVSLKNLPANVSVIYSGVRKASDAGTYTVTATLVPTANYELSGQTVYELTWKINPAVINVGDYTWTSGSFVYDGTEKKVELVGVDSKLTITYTGNTATNAGEYTATATAVSNDPNYVAEGQIAACSWTIAKAKIDVSDYEWNYTDAFTYEAGVEYTVALKNVDSKLVATYTDNAKTNAGTYTAKVTFAVADEYADNYEVDGSVEALIWTIAKAKIQVNDVKWNYTDAFTYDGTEKSVALTNLPEFVTVEYTGVIKATNAGKYTATATLSTDGNYELVGTTELTLEWTINKAKINVSDYEWNYTGAFTFDGETKTVELKNVDSKLVATYTDNAKIEAGTYTAKVTFAVADEYAANYEVEGSVEALSWSIVAGQVAVPTVSDTELVYNGEEQSVFTAPEGALYTVSGNTATTVGKYTLTFTLVDADNYTWSDGTVEPKTVEWTIVPAVINVSDYTWTSGSFVYDGTEKKVELVGVDSKLTITYTGNTATNAGSYTATAVAVSNDPNYVVEGKIADCSWTIAKAEINVGDYTWTSGSFVYDGTEKKVELVGVDSKLTITYTGNTATNAGSYTATAVAVSNDPNYVVVGKIADCSWTIAKAVINVSGYTWTSGSFVYDGTEKKVELVGVNSKLAITYTGNTATNAGEYTATATAVSNDSNYVVEGVIADCSWTIEQASIKVDGVKWNYTEAFVYDGTEKSVALINLPEFVKAVYGATGTTGINAGKYNAIATLVCTNDNYKLVGNTELELEWTIEQAEIKVDGVKWNYTDAFTYDGTEKSVALTNLPGFVTVTYGGTCKATNAGKYTATATLATDGNHKLSGNTELTLEWTIEKAEIKVDGVKWNYTDAFTYDGTEKSVALTNLPGLVTVTYGGTFKATNAGQYTATATLTTDGNHKLVGTTELELKWTVNKRTVVVPTIETLSFVFNGKEQTVYSEIPNAPYTLANNKATNVGSYKLTFILKDKANYVWNGLNTAEDQVINWTITKAELSDITVGGEYKRTETGDREYTFTLPANAGTVTFGEIVKTDANGVVSKISVVNGKVTVTLSGAASAGSTAQYVIPVTMSNYKDITITVNVNLMKADVPTVSVEDITVVYNGEAVNAAIIANFATANVSGKWTFVTDVSAMINAGTYDVVVKFTPDNLDDYLDVTVNAKLVIKKATPTVAVKYNKVYAGGTLADAKLAVAESSVPGSVYWIEPVTTKVEKGVSYVWIFIPADETNYNTVSGSAALYQETAPFNPIVPPAGWVNPYTDIREGTWYYDAVKFVTEKGLMNGVGNGKFAPGGTVTRATLMTILARRAGVNTNGGANWYEKGMAWAVAQGISDGTNPDADITREQIVTMMWRAVGCPDFSHVDLGRFNDGKTVSSWAEDAVKWAVGVGLLNGKDGNMLDPTGTATRAEMATILMRFVIYFG